MNSNYLSTLRRALFYISTLFLLTSCTFIISANNHFIFLDNATSIKDNKIDWQYKEPFKHTKPVKRVESVKSIVKIAEGPLNIPIPPMVQEKTCPSFVLPTLIQIPATPIERLNRIAPTATKQLDDIMLSYIRELIAISSTNQTNVTKAYGEYIKQCDDSRK